MGLILGARTCQALSSVVTVFSQGSWEVGGILLQVRKLRLRGGE